MRTTSSQPHYNQHLSNMLLRTPKQHSQPQPQPTKSRQARIPIPTRTQTTFYKPNDIWNVTAAIRQIMDIDSPSPPIFPTDNDQANTDTDIMRSYAIDTLFASEYYSGDTEEIETIDALRPPDRKQFITTIQKENHTIIDETGILVPIHRNPDGGYIENKANKRTWKIRTTLKCKRKKKANEEPDKHKARGADTLRRAMIKADVQLPTTYSPTIMPLTFSLFLQLATISKFKMASMDIKSAYLNAPLPDEADWITTTLEPHIAEVCGQNPAQEYRIANALYGLPDSGRIFYLHYKAALTAEGYIMSQFDNYLLYKISATETTYIIVYVDDTFILSNTDANIESVITSIGKH